MRERSKMGRPREFDEDQALETIMHVFWEKGFEGASLSDLVAATGLKKGSLYAAFGDKRAMYYEALAYYDRTWISKTVDQLRGESAPAERIARFLQSAIDMALGKDGVPGCFVCNAAIDRAPIDSNTDRLVNTSLGSLEQALIDTVSEIATRTKSSSYSARNRRRKARYLASVYFGLLVLGRAGVDPGVLKDARQVALDALSKT